MNLKNYFWRNSLRRELTEKLKSAIAKANLSQVEKEIIAASQPSIMIELQSCEESDLAIGNSKIGGNPDLPVDFSWPIWKGKPMGFLGQINLEHTSIYDIQGLLPTSGLLTFFYDLYKQPWGFDPKDLDASKIGYFTPGTILARKEVPESEIYIPC